MAVAGGSDEPVLHVVVVGFHHKKGCQLEFAYPPLIEGNAVDSHDLPLEWKHLPSLALPDGAHNYDKDTIYFHLKALGDTMDTVYGISCYRQMDSLDLVNKTADVTRSTVQKSVCVLSKLPLYGPITAKLELITHAYFEQGDFTIVSLLEDTFRNVNQGVGHSVMDGSRVLLGFAARELVLKFRHKLLILFKLILLERKVIFFLSPVKALCNTILSLLSLFPGMVECGLKEAACCSQSRRISSVLKMTNVTKDTEDYLEVQYAKETEKPITSKQAETDITSSEIVFKEDHFTDNDDEKSTFYHNSLQQETVITSQPTSPIGLLMDPFFERSDEKMAEEVYTQLDSPESLAEIDKEDTVFSWNNDRLHLAISDDVTTDKSIEDCSVEENNQLNGACTANENRTDLAITVNDKKKSNIKDTQMTSVDLKEGDSTPEKSLSNSSSKSSLNSLTTKASAIKNKLSMAFARKAKSGPNRTVSEQVNPKSSNEIRSRSSDDSAGSGSFEGQSSRSPSIELRPMSPISLTTDECGFPLAVFTKGSLCHPYLSLQYIDLLEDINVRSFVVGATNYLFKQKRHLSDVIVEFKEDGELNIEIRDNELKKQLSLTTADLRFADYLVKMVTHDEGHLAFDGTGWEGGDEWLRAQFKYYLMSLLQTASSKDAKLAEDFNSHFMNAYTTTQNYTHWLLSNHPGIEQVEPGHPNHGQGGLADMKLRLSHSMQSTERGRKINAAVVQTGKAVGGALSSAKSAVSSWWSSFSNKQSTNAKTEEVSSSVNSGNEEALTEKQ